MTTSFYTKLGISLKRIIGIHDMSLFRKRMIKRIGKLLYHKKYTADDIINVMKKLGMKEGSLICVHSSMMQFYNYRGSAEELISKILLVLGPEGTLMMPAFPEYSKAFQKDYIFDKAVAPTAAGYLAETFRKFPNVKRSVNVIHSVCAIGKYSDYLIKDHQYCHDCWDKNSPWYRMCELDGLVFCLGMPKVYIGTFEHCVESLLQYDYPYWKQFFTKKITFRYYDDNKEIQQYDSFTEDIDRRRNGRKVLKYFTSSEMKSKKISNLNIKVYQAKSCLNKMVELGKRGICIYYVPSPKKYFKK